MGRALVFVGGGHAHLTALCNIPSYSARGHRVTLVSPTRFHYYSGMGPGLLSGTYAPQQVRFNLEKMTEDRGARFIMDKV
ncbi:MAG: pyridine nucleotide-disulfide oxidoreductase, partial [Chloroflexota bacterium]